MYDDDVGVGSVAKNERGPILVAIGPHAAAGNRHPAASNSQSGPIMPMSSIRSMSSMAPMSFPSSMSSSSPMSSRPCPLVHVFSSMSSRPCLPCLLLQMDAGEGARGRDVKHTGESAGSATAVEQRSSSSSFRGLCGCRSSIAWSRGRGWNAVERAAKGFVASSNRPARHHSSNNSQGETQQMGGAAVRERSHVGKRGVPPGMAMRNTRRDSRRGLSVYCTVLLCYCTGLYG
jgi:hypothetical protein